MSTIDDVLLISGLKFDHLSISQLRDIGNKVIFRKYKCVVKNLTSCDIVLIVLKNDNVYTVSAN